MTDKSIAIADATGQFLEAIDTELPIYSLTKTFIAAMVIECGVDTEAPISAWFESDLVPRAADITVAQLLNHTSGLRDYGGLADYQAAIESGQGPWTDDEFADHTLRQSLLFEPGTGWAYSNPGYWLLSRIVQRETDTGFAEALARLITDPLGLARTRVAEGKFADDLPSYPTEWVWHGLLLSTASDVVRFMGSALVPPLLVKLTRVPIEHPAWIDPHNGYGLMVEPGVRYGHNGGGPNYSASCFHFIERRLTGCVLLRADTEDAAMNELLRKIERYPAKR